MAKPSKKKISELLAQWKEAKESLAKSEAWRDGLIAPVKEQFDLAVAPFIQAADEQMKPVLAELKKIEAEITEQLELGINEDGSCQLPQVAIEGALAEVATSTQREIEPERFFAEVPDGSRDAGFWGCVKILIQKVEKKFGDKVDSWSHKKVTHRVNIRLTE